MMPPDGFVRDLHAMDPTLRVRWARHQERWQIEVKCWERSPTWILARPSPLGKNARARDLWESWQDGYLLVLAVPRDLLSWPIVAPQLASLRIEAHRAAEALADKLDALEEDWERSTDRLRENLVEDGTLELYDRCCWDQGRRVSFANPEPKPEPREGYSVIDRRVTVTHGA